MSLNVTYKAIKLKAHSASWVVDKLSMNITSNRLRSVFIKDIFPF